MINRNYLYNTGMYVMLLRRSPVTSLVTSHQSVIPLSGWMNRQEWHSHVTCIPYPPTSLWALMINIQSRSLDQHCPKILSRSLSFSWFVGRGEVGSRSGFVTWCSWSGVGYWGGRKTPGRGSVGAEIHPWGRSRQNVVFGRGRQVMLMLLCYVRSCVIVFYSCFLTCYGCHISTLLWCLFSYLLWLSYLLVLMLVFARKHCFSPHPGLCYNARFFSLDILVKLVKLPILVL